MADPRQPLSQTWKSVLDFNERRASLCSGRLFRQGGDGHTVLQSSAIGVKLIAKKGHSESGTRPCLPGRSQRSLGRRKAFGAYAVVVMRQDIQEDIMGIPHPAGSE